MAEYGPLTRQMFERAFGLAQQAAASGEVPVGALLVKDEQIIAEAHNQIIALHDPTAHAELLAVRQAARILGNERLVGCELYSTLEPCTMCSGALLMARVEAVHVLAYEERLPAMRQVQQLSGHNHQIAFTRYQMPEFDVAALLSNFFQNKR